MQTHGTTSTPSAPTSDVVTSYGSRDLYGGAMTVQLPVELIDSSDLRQIPDHQEVFLSPTTLTSIIFEINDYTDRPDDRQQDDSNSTTTPTTTTVVNGHSATGTAESHADPDADAAKYHFTDVISPPDTLAAPLPSPQRVALQSPSLASYPAYLLTGNIRSFDTSRQALQAASASSTSPPQSLVHQIQLLIRMEEHATDLCVRINVPLKELAGDDAAAAAEAEFARALLASVVSTLDVVDFRLFGAQ